MIAADTNLLARFLIKDVPEHFQRVNDLLNSGEEGYINPVVLSELYWVLVRLYEYSKIEFLTTLDALLETEGFVFFDQGVIRRAMADYLNSTADFTDCLINQINLDRKLKTFTFDRKAAKLEGMKLLS
ncbi:MAG: type II toxin-antitoxin system VapC family toxin [Balneolaceae bacterium]|nr:type II toxin-antitoxin system VapC family toxin [Balneolaceae bacterium]MBO6545889.1 type II toxin-antitoxin system VapC family toxin [Balneolaceae bacterium]MBO6647285.1 type II toxin-antitoxin system VapC family toxin [Balneolaceae bacterium]